jgi:hypothetical protein
VKENTCYSLSYYFKDYRALALQLSKEEVNVGTIGDEENDSPTAAASASVNGNSNSNDKAPVGSGYRTNPSANSTDGSLHLPLPPFPRTYARSTFGIKLGETELQERAEGLDRWLRALLQRYQLYSAVVQVLTPLSSVLLLTFPLLSSVSPLLTQLLGGNQPIPQT